MRQLEEGFFVAGQVKPDELEAVRAEGIGMIVNNRPDGEEPGQPTSGEMEQAAAAAGLAYRFVPVAQLTPEAIEGMREALAAAEAKGGGILAFCKSGTRSTYLWALARSLDGAEGETLAQGAAAAGYDLTPIRRFLR